MQNLFDYYSSITGLALRPFSLWRGIVVGKDIFGLHIPAMLALIMRILSNPHGFISVSESQILTVSWSRHFIPFEMATDVMKLKQMAA